MAYSDELLRWRLILGKDCEQQPPFNGRAALPEEWQGIDKSLSFVFEEGERRGGTGASSPYIADWLQDIRTYFPKETVSYLQKEAIERKGLRQLLLEPEILEKLERNVELAATLVELKHLIPDKTKDTARLVIQDIVRQLRKKLEEKVAQTVIGAISRESRPYMKGKQIDFAKTVRHNIKHYLPELKTFIPEQIYFYEQQSKLNDWNVVVCVDQSGSMGTSVVYSSIMASIFASLNLFQTHLVFFDTEIADMTDHLTDPVDILFGIQLGGGTDINRAVQYCQGLISQPDKTLFFLITDLYEGGDRHQLISRLEKLYGDQVKMLCLLALNDEGHAVYDRRLAQDVANIGIPTFACTPNKLVELVERIFAGESLPQQI